jgi:surface-anchored protein
LATPASGLTVGDSFWKLPQSATEAAIEGSPWLGLQIHGGPLGSDGASSSSANVSLQLVSATGPGQFLMWQDLEPNLYGLGGPGGPGFESRSDLFASPAAAFNSAASAGNHVDCWQHMHTHANWGFTAPGEYAVTLSLTGETAEDGAFSDQATFRFLVEDSSLGVPRFGDLTGDGIVTQADLTRLSQSFGTTDGATPATGDLNGDGRVGLRDLMLLRNELGGRPQTPATTDWNSTTLPTIGSQLEGATIGGPIPSLDFSTASSIAAAAAVPEPGALALAGCGGLTMAWLSRRRRKQ